jgi:hypothetical protein
VSLKQDILGEIIAELHRSLLPNWSLNPGHVKVWIKMLHFESYTAEDWIKHGPRIRSLTAAIGSLAIALSDPPRTIRGRGRTVSRKALHLAAILVCNACKSTSREPQGWPCSNVVLDTFPDSNNRGKENFKRDIVRLFQEVYGRSGLPVCTGAYLPPVPPRKRPRTRPRKTATPSS